jgi:membrane protein DedA with SNARE-associated domain
MEVSQWLRLDTVPLGHRTGKYADGRVSMLDLNQLITDWGYAGIFLVVILGNIGLPVPEETVLAVAGYLVWSGRLHLLPVLLVGLASAVVGDNVGYWLGAATDGGLSSAMPIGS